MKTPYFFKPRYAALGGSMLLMAVNSVSAHAGEWQMRLVYSWDRDVVTWNSSQQQMVPITSPTSINQTPWTSSGQSLIGPQFFSATGWKGGTASANQKDVVTGELRWVPSSNETLATDPPSDKIFIKLRGNAAVSLRSQTNGTHNVKSGLGHPEVQTGTTTTTTDGYQQNVVDWQSSNWNGSPIIFPIDNKDHQSEISFGPFEVVSQGSVSQPKISQQYPPNTYADPGSSILAGTDFGAELTPIGVFISSDIEKSWKKWTGSVANLPLAYKNRNAAGAYIDVPNGNAELVSPNSTDPSKNVWKLACLRNADGSITVESAAQWMTSPNVTQFKAWLGGGHFTANTQGFLDPTNYDWTPPSQARRHDIGSTPEVYNLHADAPTTTVPYYGIKLGEEEDGSDLVSYSTLTVKAINPNLEMSNSYTVNWHLPREKWTQYGPTQSIFQNPPIEVDAPGYATQNGGVNVSYLPSGDYWGEAVNTGISDLLAVAGNLLPPPYSGLAAAADLTSADSERAHVPVSFNDNWGTPDATYVPSRNDSQKAFYHMTVERSVGYNIRFWDGECYDQHGYTGQEKKATANLNGAEKWVATFELQNGDSTTLGSNG